MVKKTSVEVVRLNIEGTVTHFAEKQWIEDGKDINGGYYSWVKKKYEKPKVRIDFLGKVDVGLRVGGFYSDGTNIFMAISENEIRNHFRDVDSFTIPKVLTLVCSSFNY